jgi:hypothetical protein
LEGRKLVEMEDGESGTQGAMLASFVHKLQKQRPQAAIAEKQAASG